MQAENLFKMNDPRVGMDVIIVSTSSLQQKQFWEERLLFSKDQQLKPNVEVVVVLEDWKGGAGNLLGTLYAFQEAQKQVDLVKKLESGASIAIYHTAGRGKRLWPLAGSEQGNKSAVKLPEIIAKANEKRLMTLLEAVIKQTSIYSVCGQGRLSVFWGDQIFIPSLLPPENIHAHIASLVMKIPMPQKGVWDQKKLWQYGIFLTRGSGGHVLSEKIDFDTLQYLVQVYQTKPEMGINLGSFSVSLTFLKQLLNEYEEELHSKKGHLDTDPHLWMPLTHDFEVYVKLSKQNIAEENFQRVAKMKAKMSGELYSGIDIGAQSDWWDYGSVLAYYMNNMKLIGSSDESARMRAFFQVSEDSISATHSLMVDCEITNAQLSNSVALQVKADHVASENSLLIDVESPDINVSTTCVYHVRDNRAVRLSDGDVLADINSELRLKTKLESDGKADWGICLEGNEQSYEEVSRNC